ncbi:hypothetical protein BC939DRAFT_498232 [Gamsiella multidivaricata]|uniref:uncharacterized protein n=1 Tax=Gamsiella multidivaricata TaxID=101098 RepID=UPI0022205C42|nr:uncharacterized protein BC939DRAFT_498232 [Gamsiella multidivaricata]KAI7832832.1 hypothetical protein BC939DRAFT_498232 [Gamsiella multidivaricata]
MKVKSDASVHLGFARFKIQSRQKSMRLLRSVGMIDDNQLTALVNGLCCAAMFLIVVYHFVAVNAKPAIQQK